MSAPTEPTAVTVPAEKKDRLSNLPPEIQAAILLRQQQNTVVATMASMNWGEKLPIEVRRAVAEWGRKFNIDLATEVDVLGNKFYLNAVYYIRKLTELVDAGLVDYHEADLVHADPRLDEAIKSTDAANSAWAQTEKARRFRERILHGIPEDATGACVYRVKLKALDREMSGANWCGGASKPSDPVGKANPVNTSISRAARRTVRMLASHVKALATEVQQVESSGQELGMLVGEATERQVEQNKISGEVGRHQLKAGGYEDPAITGEPDLAL